MKSLENEETNYQRGALNPEGMGWNGPEILQDRICLERFDANLVATGLHFTG